MHLHYSRCVSQRSLQSAMIGKLRNFGFPSASLRHSHWRNHSQTGFTLIEVLTSIAIVGALVAIAAPGWRAFHLNLKLNAAQDTVFQAMRQAQAEAIRSHLVWQLSLRQQNNKVQWAIHPSSLAPTNATWEDLLPEIQIDTGTTTLNQQNATYYLRFNGQGRVSGQLGRVNLKIQNSDRHIRCIYASTLLGTLRRATDQNCQ